MSATFSFFFQTKVGSWNSLDHLDLSREEKKSLKGEATDPMANKTFVITAILVRLFLAFLHSIMIPRMIPTQCW